MKLERIFCPHQLEVRADMDKPPRIEGYAARFYREGDPETEFELGPGMVERIMPGAFNGALQRPDDVRALFNHDPNVVLGRNTAGTLRLSIDEAGLRFSIDPPDTAAARDAMTLIERGDVDGASFGFMIEGREGDHMKKDGDRIIREVRAVRLLDVSPVTYAAYSGTSTSLSRDRFSAWEEVQRLTESRQRLDEQMAELHRDHVEELLAKIS